MSALLVLLRAQKPCTAVCAVLVLMVLGLGYGHRMQSRLIHQQKQVQQVLTQRIVHYVKQEELMQSLSEKLRADAQKFEQELLGKEKLLFSRITTLREQPVGVEPEQAFHWMVEQIDDLVFGP